MQEFFLDQPLHFMQPNGNAFFTLYYVLNLNPIFHSDSASSKTKTQ